MATQRLHAPCAPTPTPPSRTGCASIEALAEVARPRRRRDRSSRSWRSAAWPVTGPAGADQRACSREALDAGRRPRRRLPAPRRRHRRRRPRRYLLRRSPPTTASASICTPTRRSIRPSTGSATCRRAVLAGFDLGATASHCVSLGQQPLRATSGDVAERVAAAGHQRRRAPPHQPVPAGSRPGRRCRAGSPRSRALRAAGVNVAAGADNLQDPFNPVGRACPFETAGLMIMAAHLTPQEAWRAVSSAPACVLGRQSPARRGRGPGAPDRRPRGHACVRRSRSDRPTVCGCDSGRPIGEIQS